MYEQPFEFARANVKPARAEDRNKKTRDQWWLYERPRIDLRKFSAGLPRFIVTPVVAKHRLFAWRGSPTLAMNLLDIVARADDTAFGILHSRFHELWTLRSCTWLGVGNDPRYTPTPASRPFPSPLASRPRANREGGWAAEGSAQVKEEPAQRAGDTEQSPLPLSRPERATTSPGVRQNAIAIAQAAKRLNDLRENWLNPPEWTHRVPEVIPLGMDKSPYPDRIEPRSDISEADLKALQKRTLTNLYNQRPAWLAMAHQQLDAAVAAAYGWTDYSPDMPDDEILKRLLALNLERSATIRQESVGQAA